VLVAGGDGFLGRNCVELLLELDARVSILTRSQSSSGRNPAIERIFRGDIQNPELAREAVSDVSLVFDFAGSSGALDSNQRPTPNLEECGAQLNLFQAAARASHPPKVLFCSSRLVYGRPLYVPVAENHPLAPQSFYAAHKVTAESYLKVLSHTHGLRFTVLRVSNPYGPHQASRHKNYGVINQFLQRAAAGEAIRVYGEGAQIRDYIHARDLIAGFVLCGESSRCDGELFNIGGREPVRLYDAAETITRLAGAPPLVHEPWPADYERIETGDYVTDLAKIDRFVDLPQPCSLEEGFSLSLEAYRHETERSALSGALRPGGAPSSQVSI